MAMQDLRFGFQLELAQLFLQARDRAAELGEVELDRADLLLQARAEDADFAGVVEQRCRAGRRRRARIPGAPADVCFSRPGSAGACVFGSDFFLLLLAAIGRQLGRERGDVVSCMHAGCGVLRLDRQRPVFLRRAPLRAARRRPARRRRIQLRRRKRLRVRAATSSRHAPSDDVRLRRAPVRRQLSSAALRCR